MNSLFFYLKFEMRRGKKGQRSDLSLFVFLRYLSLFLGQNFLFNLLFYFICCSAYWKILKISYKGCLCVKLTEKSCRNVTSYSRSTEKCIYFFNAFTFLTLVQPLVPQVFLSFRQPESSRWQHYVPGIVHIWSLILCYSMSSTLKCIAR